jgi:hypothetical protein
MSVLRRTAGITPWERLHACVPSAHVRDLSACDDVPAYHALVRRMKREVDPPFQLAQLELPRHTRVLAYGHSYLKQVVHELACVGRFVVLPGVRDEACPNHAGHYHLHDRAHNVTITVVSNVAPLQHSRTLQSGALARFLATSAFDLVYYMPAHADCFFDYQAEMWVNERSLARPCVNLSTVAGAGSANRDARVWRLLVAHTRRALVVRAWVPHMEWHVQTQRPDTSWSNGSSVVDPSKLIANFACRVPECAPDPSGHQCWHSGVVLAARELASWSRGRRR